MTTTKTQVQTTDPVLDVHAVCEWLKISRTTLWQMLKRDKFPQPFRVGRGLRSLRWRESVIQSWITEQEQKN